MPLPLAPAPAFPTADCPCVNATALLMETAPDLLNNTGASCSGWQAQLAGSSCLGSDYGSSVCSAWDAAPADCLARTGQIDSETCGQQWCYVDGRQCESALHSPATYLFNGQEVPASASLAYSYGTCGWRVDRGSNAGPSPSALPASCH